MQQAEFEQKLSQTQRKRRLIEGVLALLFLVIFIAFLILMERTKEVTILGGPAPIPTWESTRYNEAYIPFIAIGLVGAIYCGIMLLVDHMMCGFTTVCKDMQHITVYRGMLHNTVYVDGQERGRRGPFDHTQVVEVWLANRVKVTVSFCRTIWCMAHISFSDDTASIEV